MTSVGFPFEYNLYVSLPIHIHEHDFPFEYNLYVSLPIHIHEHDFLLNTIYMLVCP